jgi:hypothetical protein
MVMVSRYPQVCVPGCPASCFRASSLAAASVRCRCLVPSPNPRGQLDWVTEAGRGENRPNTGQTKVGYRPVCLKGERVPAMNGWTAPVNQGTERAWLGRTGKAGCDCCCCFFSPSKPKLNRRGGVVQGRSEVRRSRARGTKRLELFPFEPPLGSHPNCQQAAAWPHRKPLQRICRAKLEMALARAGGQLPQLHYPSDAISSERARLTSLCALSLDTQTWRVPGSMYERTYSNTVCTHVLYST